MEHPRRYLTLRDYLRVLRQQRWLILIVTVVFAAAGFVYSLQQPTVYEAQATLRFTEPTQPLDLFGNSVAPTQSPDALAAEGARLITEPEVLQRAIDMRDLKQTPEELIGRVEALAEARTNFVVVSATAGHAVNAAQLANAVARAVEEELTDRTRERLAALAESQEESLREQGTDEDRGGELFQEIRIAQLRGLADVVEPVQVVSRARPPEGASSPQPVRNTLFGALIGLTLGLIAAFVRDSLDRRLRGARDIEQHMKLPMIGSVSASALGRSRFAGNGRDAISPLDLEAFRILRMNLEFLDVDNPLQAMVITSGLPQEGKTTVASWLAHATAGAGKKTLLIECDLRRPAVAERLGIAASPGLTDYLTGNADLDQAIQYVSEPAIGQAAPTDGAPEQAGEGQRLACIVAGSATPNPAELLGSKRFERFVAEVRGQYEAIFFDSAPLLPVADTLEVIPHADGVVVCVRSRQTTRDQAHAARSVLENLPLRPTALVVTGVRPGEDTDYGHYSYTYAYGATTR